MIDGKYVIAYLGFGRATQQYHLPYTYENKLCSVRYVFVREEDRKLNLDKEALYPKIDFITNFDIILEDQEIDFVVICTPNDTHFDYACKLMKSGIHCIIEKPLANNRKDAEKLYKLAQDKNISIMPNQNRRFDGDYLTLKKVLDRNVLGDILEIESHYDYFRPNRDTSKPMYLFGMAVHTMDQMIALNGIPDDVVYDVRSMHNPGHCDDYFDIDLFYGRKKVTVKTSYYVKISSPRFIVHGTKGSCIIPQVGHESENIKGNSKEKKAILSYIQDDGKEINEQIELTNNDYFGIYRNFIDVISKRSDKIVQNHEVITVLEILEKGVQKSLNIKA